VSLLPFSSNVSATSAGPSAIRARHTDRPQPAERASRNESADETSRTDKADREHTPPDFSLLLALLGGTPPKPATDATPETLTLDMHADDGDADVQVLTVDSEIEADQPGSETETPSTMADADQRALARALQSDAMRAARAILVSNNVENRSLASIGEREPSPGVNGLAKGRAAELAAALAGVQNEGSLNAAGTSNADLLALAERAAGRGRGELMARNDQRAADVRAALDALLDVAGTPRGRVIAETARPEFANAVAKSAENVATPVRDVEGLAPEFRARLDRIVDRMRDEFGHDVQIVETVRSGERQEHLYAQGRTAPGPIVTWTTNSAHESGEAADVIIDGKWNHPVAYARLHAIAAEEGVKTLGMRDPGHLELRGAANGLHGDDALRDGIREPSTRVANMGGIAQVASVARVAHVAQVAQVAQVARPGNGVRAGALRTESENVPLLDNARPSDTASAFGARISDIASQGRARQGGAGGTSDREPRGNGSERTRGLERAVTVADAGSAVGALHSSVDRVLDGGVPRVQAPAGSTAAARAEAIAVLREDAPAPSVSSLTMTLDTPTGAEEIRVNLRGGAVGAQISTSNAALADRLRMQTADLQDALGRHGLETEPLRVQKTARSSEGDAMRQAMSERSEVLKTAGASHGQQMGQQHTHDSNTKERPTAKQQPGRDARDEQESNHQQGRRNNRQENH
jgi:hypothetical protein